MVAASSIDLGVRAAVIVFFSLFWGSAIVLIILVTIIDYFNFFNYMSSSKFYHDCILARIKCQKKQQTNKQKQKNWLDTLLTSKEK